MDEVLRRNGKAITSDDSDVIKLVLMFENMHPELAVPPDWRTKPPSPSVISAFCLSCGLTVQRTIAKKRALTRPTFEAEASHALENINKFPIKGVLDEWHGNAGDTKKYGRNTAGEGLYSLGNIRAKQSWTNIAMLFDNM